jgi:lipoprotein-releasing system permease protein
MNIAKYIAKRSYSSFKKSYTKKIIGLAIAATSLSLAVMIISQSIYNGFQREIANNITDINVNRSVESELIKTNYHILDQIRNMRLPGEDHTPVRHLQTFLIYPSIAASKTEFEGLFIKGVGLDYDWQFFSDFLSRGNIINYKDNQNREILISELTASRLRVDTGQSIVLNFLINEQSVKRKMHITGIYNTGLGEYDRKFALIDKMLLQQILQKDSTEVTGIEVFCNDILQADKINDYLYEEILPSNWYSETIRSKYPNIFEWLALQDVTKYFILLLILAVCIINMSTTTMILIFERTHMVGVLTVLGMTRWTQQKIFLRYASRILLSSIVIGNLIGYGLCFIQNKYKLLKLSESDYYLSYVPIDMSVMPVIILNILFFTLILLFLFLPTIIVQSIQPVKALKFR